MIKISGTLFLAYITLTSAYSTSYKVRVRNLSYGQTFSPPLVIAHTNGFAIFKEGLQPSDALKAMAENGNNTALLTMITMDDVAPYICGSAVASGPLEPGETVRLDIVVDKDVCGDSPLYSLVGMLVNTNDAFMGIDSDRVGSTKVYPPAFDAGTEKNNELCSHIPGPACDMDSGNMEDDPGEGFVHIHRGVHGIGDIYASDYDWRNPVAEVFVSAV